jgi:hypothetical protein
VTGEEERSSVQENVETSRSEAGLTPYDTPPRRYYRLTREGIEAPDYEWSNPLITCHPEIAGVPAWNISAESVKNANIAENNPPNAGKRYNR